MGGTKAAPRAYLIGGDGFHKVFWPCLVAAFCITHGPLARATPIGAIHALWKEAYDILLDRLMRGSASMMWWSLFGLLSSSCCALQLILNVFNFGCAGFNTYLGPVRPAFLGLTIVLNARMWELALPNLGLPSTPDHYLPSLVVSTIFAALLSLLPEITDFRNRKVASEQEKIESVAKSATNKKTTEVVLGLEGLGCVACTSAVQRAVQGAGDDTVLAVAVTLEKKEARITLACSEQEARDTVVPDLISRIEDAGFDASLQSMPKRQVSSESNRSQTPRQSTMPTIQVNKLEK